MISNSFEGKLEKSETVGAFKWPLQPQPLGLSLPKTHFPENGSREICVVFSTRSISEQYGKRIGKRFCQRPVWVKKRSFTASH